MAASSAAPARSPRPAPARLTLTGANTYSGGTTISAGTLQVGNGGTTGTHRPATSSTTASLAFNRSDALTYRRRHQRHRRAHPGRHRHATLTGANTYTGGTTIAPAPCRSATAAPPASSPATSSTTAPGLQPQRQRSPIAGVISGTGTLTQAGTGTRPSPAPTPTPAARRSAPAPCRSATAAPTGTIVGNVVDNGALAFNRSDALTFGGIISGTGSVSPERHRHATLTGANTYTGGTTISGGTSCWPAPTPR